ncbi:Uncharacterised protein [Candidatus Tiddalikarchaeum anstoanum]|nr:Uncharacterised protein [Candidatus Tiddalikarchaeum anstoanum]
MNYNIFYIAFIVIILALAFTNLKLIYNVLEVIFGIIILTISKRSLKRSIIRRWREGFTLLLFGSLAGIAHGLLTIGGILPEMLNSAIFTIFFLLVTISIWRLSSMHGLKA